MRYVAAYLLAVLGGKANPSAEDVQKILESIGIDVEDDKLQKVNVSFTFSSTRLPLYVSILPFRSSQSWMERTSIKLSETGLANLRPYPAVRKAS